LRSLIFDRKDLKILCFGAHPDDIEIGCGGTILHLIDNYNVEIFWIVLSGNEERKKEANKSANLFLNKSSMIEVKHKNFRENYFPQMGMELKNYFNTQKKIAPDIIFTHYRNDIHQDHRLISEYTLNTFRDNIILEYEIPKYDGDLSNPNVYFQLNKKICENKINYILSSFKTQEKKDWFDKETFWSILRLRGLESKSPSKYAEAFHVKKMCLK
jgi:LmbE family N-acetylglucosaminyl deacetylase